LYERLVAHGGKGVSVSGLGGNRAGEMRITRFLCGFRRCRPGIPIDVGHLFRSKSAGRSD